MKNVVNLCKGDLTIKIGIPATLICPNSKCDNISSKLYIVENQIIKALKIWLKNYKIDYDNLQNTSKSIK